MAKKNDKKNKKTDHSTFFKDKIQVNNGDFVAGDKNISGGDGSVVVGGNITGGTIITGDGNQVGGAMEISNIFSPVYIAIVKSDYPEAIKADLKADIEEIEVELSKEEPVDENFLSRRLRSVKRMAPDILDLLVSALAGPGAVISTTVKKIAEKVKTEA